MNKFRLTGSIKRLKKIETKTGTPMASWSLKVGEKDYFDGVAFGDTAKTLLAYSEGDVVVLDGKLEKRKPREEGSKEWTIGLVAELVMVPQKEPPKKPVAQEEIPF